MLRIVLPTIPRATHYVSAHSFVAGRRFFAESKGDKKGAQNSTPGWEGREGDDHVLNRDRLDVQSATSNEAREAKEKGEEGSTAISQKDELNSNDRAKKENPEAPGPVIGMNSERGGKY